MAVTGTWQDTVRSRLPRATVWVLAVALGIQAAILVTRWAGSGAADSVAPAVAQPAAASQQRVDVAAIVNAHLFGAAPDVATGGNAPRTRMPLVLTGTLASDRPREGLAILGQNPGAVRVYAVGDTVPGGARLHAVYDDRVLLDRNGHLESLMLLRHQSGRPPALGAATAPVQRAVARVRNLMSYNPGVLESVMRPQPFFVDGKLAGYRVYPGPNTRAFASLGLRPGDLVTAIDGTPINDPSRADEIFRTLGSSSEARVTVLRAGQQQNLVLDLARVASEADQLTGGAGDSSPPKRAGRGP